MRRSDRVTAKLCGPPPAFAHSNIGSTAPTRRFHAMDWLRCGAFLLLVFVHSATMFSAGGWHLEFPELPGLATFLALCKPWRMGLIFLVSATALSYSLDRRGAKGFAAQACERLLPPLLVGIVLLVPPVFFFESVTHGAPIGLPDAYVAQMRRIAEGDLTWYIFWYLGYLLAFCLGLAAIWHVIRGPVSALRHMNIGGDRSALPAVLLLALPLIAVEVLLSPHFPPRRNFVSDIASVASFGILFLYGMTVMRNERVIAALRGNVMLLFVVATLVTVAALQASHWAPALADGLRGAQIWLTICFLTGAAIRFLDRPARFVTEFNRIVFPFYMLHQVAILAVAWLLAGLTSGWSLYAATAVLAPVLSIAVIRLAILPLPALHPWFGILRKDPLLSKISPCDRVEELSGEPAKLTAER